MGSKRVKRKNILIVAILFLFLPILLTLGIYFLEKNFLLTPQEMTQKCVESRNWTNEQCGANYFD